MFSHRIATLAAAAVFIATAQSDYYILPSSVDINTRSELTYINTMPILYTKLTCLRRRLVPERDSAMSLYLSRHGSYRGIGKYMQRRKSTSTFTHSPKFSKRCHCSRANILCSDIKTTLTYGCLCNDGTTPNTSEYSLTLPYFTCVEWVSQCVAACSGDSDCQGACQQDHPCGASDPKQYNATTTASSTTASSTSDGSTVYTGLNGGSGGDSSAAGPPAFELARLYATMATLGLFGMGFVYLL